MTSSNLEERLTRIETKLSFAEDLLDELNTQVFRQQAYIERLETMIVRLAERAEQAPSNQTRDIREDIPPHY